MMLKTVIQVLVTWEAVQDVTWEAVQDVKAMGEGILEAGVHVSNVRVPHEPSATTGHLR